MPAALSRRPLVLFGLLVVAGIAVWAAATVLIEPDHTFVSEKSCPNSAFSCVILNVPRDHFGGDGTEWQVTFALQPAEVSPRKGVIVIAVGGPGQAGVPSADSYTDYFPAEVTAAYDIVFFDQRGVGTSQALQCPNAALAWYAVDDSPTGSDADIAGVRGGLGAVRGRLCGRDRGLPRRLPVLLHQAGRRGPGGLPGLERRRHADPVRGELRNAVRPGVRRRPPGPRPGADRGRTGGSHQAGNRLLHRDSGHRGRRAAARARRLHR